jgi:hypothetical protein
MTGDTAVRSPHRSDRPQNVQTFLGDFQENGGTSEVMEIENTTKAGGDAESKDVEETYEQKTGGEGATAHGAGASESERAGGDAESKGIE